MGKAKNIVPQAYGALARRVRAAWSEHTSSSAAWDPQNRESGQCAVTALLVQELHGGVLMRALVNGESHYWNEIDGETIDLTRAQFDEPLTVETPVQRERAYVLSYPITEKRYELLRQRFAELPSQERKMS